MVRRDQRLGARVVVAAVDQVLLLRKFGGVDDLRFLPLVGRELDMHTWS